MSWSEYREPGTQFIKASTKPESILEQLSKVYKMSFEERKAEGAKARKFVLNNYSIDVIGPKLEGIIDAMPEVEWDFDFTEEERDPDYMPEDIESTSDWLIDLYKNILKVDLDDSDPGHKHWMTQVAKGMKREDVLRYFKKVALNENKNISGDSIEDHLGEEGINHRIAVVINGGPREAIFLNSFLEDLQKLYMGDSIYVICDPKLNSLIEDNPCCYKTIPYDKRFDDCFLLEGKSKNQGFFKVALYPTHFTNSHPFHFHNGLDKTNLQLR